MTRAVTSACLSHSVRHHRVDCGPYHYAVPHHGTPDFNFNPPGRTFYDDPHMGYTMDKKVHNWDEEWLKLHPFTVGARERVFMVTESQSKLCWNPIGDHLLLRFFKNKVDYCRLHGYNVFYNNALLEPKLFAYWAKYPVVWPAMVAHSDAEWIWWVDSDAKFTDMEFKLPLERYREHNAVVHGWAHHLHEKRSLTGLNADVFLIRNCQWSLYFMEAWVSMGPHTPNYEKWDQTLREEYLKDAGNGKGSWRKPFITHFAGCRPCSGKYNAMYSADDCWNGMQKAFNFADNQVLRKFGYMCADLLDNAISPVPFDYPCSLHD